MAKKTITVLEGQSIWDIAVQEYGGIEAVSTIERLNGVSRNVPLEPGTLLVVDGDPVDADLLRQIKDEHVRPVTASNGEVVLSVDSGFSKGFSIGFRS